MLETSFTLTNRTQKPFNINFYQYIPGTKINSSTFYGSVPAKSTISISFANNKFYINNHLMKKIIYKKTEKEIFGNMTLFVSSNKSILGLNKGIRWMTLKNIDIYNFLINITDKNEIDPIKTTDYYYIISAVALGGFSFLIVNKLDNYILALKQYYEEQRKISIRQGITNFQADLESQQLARINAKLESVDQQSLAEVADVAEDLENLISDSLEV